MEALPRLTSLLYKAFITLGRSKKLVGGDYKNNRTFVIASLSTERLLQFKSYFDLKESLPLPYFYLLSQGAQTALMVDKSFPLPVPGMIHINTSLTQLNDIDPDEETIIEVEVSIEDKSEGSLLPLFKEKYIQNGITVIEIESKYLVKRKSPSKTKVKREDLIIENTESNWLADRWILKRFQSYSYAKLSGDFNPIHLSSIIAYLSGFKRKFIQGWYLASKIIAEVEKETNMPAKSIEINFLKVAYLPSKLDFEFRLGHNRNLEFRISDTKSGTYLVSGYIS